MIVRVIFKELLRVLVAIVGVVLWLDAARRVTTQDVIIHNPRAIHFHLVGPHNPKLALEFVGSFICFFAWFALEKWRKQGAGDDADKL